jgi:hypothetical protein
LGEAVDLINLFQDDESNSNNSNQLNNQNDDTNVSRVDIHIVRSGSRLHGFAKIDEKFLKPFFIRKFTDEVKKIAPFFFLIHVQFIDELFSNETKGSQRWPVLHE